MFNSQGAKALPLVIVVSLCLVVTQTAQGIIVNPGVIFRMTTVPVAYNLSVAMHFTTISVRAAELVLDQFHLQFGTSPGNLTATLHTFNPSVQSGTPLSWRGIEDVAAATAWFNVTGLRPNWQYTVWVDFGQISALTSDGAGSLSFYWTTTSWGTGHEFALVASQTITVGPGPPGPLLGRGGGWIILVLVIAVSGGLLFWAFSKKRRTL